MYYSQNNSQKTSYHPDLQSSENTPLLYDLLILPFLNTEKQKYKRSEKQLIKVRRRIKELEEMRYFRCLSDPQIFHSYNYEFERLKELEKQIIKYRLTC